MVSLKTDGPVITSVIQHTGGENSRVGDNLKNAEEIFNRIPNQNNEVESNVGLIVGKIQSGKTANIITLSALAFDNGYNMIIMLLSDTNNLLTQNYNRIKNSFLDAPDVVVFEEAKNGDFLSTNTDEIKYLYETNKKIIICSLKHRQRIDEIREKIAGTGYEDDFAMIIDDEADDVSQNTSKKKYKPDGDKVIEYNRSATNRAIVDLKNIFSRSAYISVTATPQANVFLQIFQTLSPDFCYTLEPGKGYVGVSSYHAVDNDKIVEIHDFDKEKFKTESYFPKSLYEAICYFYAGIVARQKRENEFQQSFLVHPSKEIIDHRKIYNLITGKINTIRYGLERKNDKGLEFQQDVQKQYESFGNPEDVTQDLLFKLVERTRIHCINNKSDEKNLEKCISILPYHIVVGGNMLDRGITLPGLTVTYMTRESKKGQVDTLLQRARWLGYKADYFDVCKVYLTPNLKEQYEEIIEHDESLWDLLTAYSASNINLKEVDIEPSLNSEILRPTSRSKADYEVSRTSPTLLQKYFTVNSSLNKKNIELLRSYQKREGTDVVFNPVQTHKKVCINGKELKNIISQFYFHKPASGEPEDLSSESLLNSLKYNGLKDSDQIDLVFMRYNYTSKRTTTNSSTCKILNIMQGRDVNKSPDDPTYYKGDRYIVGDRIMLQVFVVSLGNNVDAFYKEEDEIIMLALLYPKQYLINSVKRKPITPYNFDEKKNPFEDF